MGPEKSILVAVDFSAGAEQAFVKALELAEKLGAALEVVHVIPPLPAELPPLEVEAATREARSSLERLCTRAQARGLEARPHLEEETVVQALLDAIERYQPGLVVVGSRGHGRVARALLGSTADALTYRSPVPVVVVPPSAHVKAEAKRTAWACSDCGHIWSENEAVDRCAQCGAGPGRWMSAPLDAGPVDVGEPAEGEAPAVDLEQDQTRDPAATFAIGPPGVEGISVNPELRVRY